MHGREERRDEPCARVVDVASHREDEDAGPDMKERLGELADDVASTEPVDDRQESRVERGRTARQLVESVVDETVRDAPIAIRVSRIGDESLLAKYEKNHDERRKERDARDDPNVLRGKRLLPFGFHSCSL